MKKKLSFILLAVVILPLIAVFGCGEVLSYPVLVYSSAGIYGSVAGNGTYDEGSTVTLTATAKLGSNFVAWVYTNNTQIENNEIYTISNTTGSDNKVSKSTLTFTMTSDTQGSYTAVFAESKMMYTKFNSFYITTNPNTPPVENGDEKNPIMQLNLSVEHGTSDEVLLAYNATDLEIKNNVIISPDNITNVLRLNTPQHIVVSAQMTQPDQSPINIIFRADIKFQQSIEETTSNNYTYKVDYSNGTYKITFKFNLRGHDHFLILNYKDL